MMNRLRFMPFELEKRPEGPPRFIIYMGSSMNPTFRSGDQLQVIPCDGGQIRPGDVIAFFAPGGGCRIIHRVVRVDSQGIKSQGDNSGGIDPWLLDPAHIEGRVAYARRGDRGWKVAGGLVGRLCAGVVRAIRLLNSGISAFLRPAYHWMARIGVLRRILHSVVTTRVVSFNRPAGKEFQLMLGRHVIGWLPPAGTTWHIRRPFRLLVDEPSLPRSL